MLVGIRWRSNASRSQWESAIRGAALAWSIAEWESVRRGIRNCALVSVASADLNRRRREFEARGLKVNVLAEKTGPSRSTSSGAHSRLVMRIAVGRDGAPTRLCDAHMNGDLMGVGRELGFPSCCCNFFQRVWVEGGLCDSTWPMAVSSSHGQVGRSSCLVVSSNCQSNILWRGLGVRAVPHLPCSFGCNSTLNLGANMVAVVRELGFQREAEDILRILAWPVEWRAHDGLATVTSSVVTALMRTDQGPPRCLILNGETA